MKCPGQMGREGREQLRRKARVGNDTQAMKGSMKLMIGCTAMHQKHDAKILVDLSRCCHVCRDNNKDCPSRHGLG